MRFLLLLTLIVYTSSATSTAQTNNRRTANRNVYYKNKVSAGHIHSFEIRNGALWGWGNNSVGELGDGTNINRNSPVQIGIDNDWVSVKAGWRHSLGLKADGTLWAWGGNFFGQLGDSTTTHRNAPVQIGNDQDWAGIAAGGMFSLAIKADGTIWAWGQNQLGQLGIGPTGNRNYPVQIGSSDEWTNIDASYYHSFGIKADGSLWAWGSNAFGRLGINSTSVTIVHNPVQVGAAHDWMSVKGGVYHSLGLKADGTVWAWGRNHFGQIGDNSTTDRYAPVQVGTADNWVYIATGSNYSMGIKANGSRWGWGLNSQGHLGNGNSDTLYIPARLDSLNNWTYIASADLHNIGLKADGTVWTWGRNTYGELGDGTTTSRNIPVQINTTDGWASISAGGFHSAAIKLDGSLWTCGNNIDGKLGIGLPGHRYQRTRIDTLNNWIDIDAAISHSIAKKADGTIWGWGNNQGGQLGDGTNNDRNTPVQVGTASDWVSIAAGYDYSMGISADGKLWTWGRNSYGQLGDGTTTHTNTPAAIDTASVWVHISAGDYHNLGIKADGTLWAWGLNNHGQLGIGSSSVVNRTTPTQIGSDDDWVSISAGAAHSTAIKADGTVWTWGWNDFGQLGDGTTTNRNAPQQVTAVNTCIRTDGGRNHTHLIKADGTLWGCGLNMYGQLGDGTFTNRSNLVQISTLNNWVDVSSGRYHTLGIRAPRVTVCGTGSNYYGELGDTSNRWPVTNNFFCNCTQANIHKQPTNTMLCDTGNTYFTVKAKEAMAYQWQVNNGNGWGNVTNNSIYDGTTTDSLTLINVNTSYHNFWYRCIAINGCNDTTYSDSAVLKVGSNVAITTQPSAVTICDSTNTIFSIQATGNNIIYQWQLNDGTGWVDINNTSIYSGATSDTLLLTAARTSNDGYKYRCKVTDVCTVISDSATLSVQPADFTSISITLDDTLCAGDPASFTATTVNGGTSPVYQWQVNGNNAGTNNDTFTISAPSSNDVVRCYMTSNAPCPVPETSLSNEINMQVLPSVTPSITITSDVGDSWCSGKENIFRSATMNGGTTPAYQWKINGTDIGADADTLWVPYLHDGDLITCVMTSSEHCTSPDTAASNSINMTIHQTTKLNIVIVANPDSIVCADKLVTMYAAFNTAGGRPYFQWMVNGKDIPGETNGTLQTTGLQDGDVVHCRLSTDTGTCVFPELSNPVGFAVKPLLAPAVSISVLYLGNDQHLFTAMPTEGGMNPVYQWYVNGKRQVNQTGSTITLTGLKPYEKVWVEMASSEQCITTDMRLVSSKTITTGIEEDISFKTLSLHPNPNNGTFIIEGNLGNAGVERVHLSVLNSIGQVVYEEVIKVSGGSLHHTVNKHNALAPGGYLLKLDHDGVQDYRRFVIVK